MARRSTGSVKYSPDGGEVTCIASLRGGVARVSVKDSGIGIARDDLPVLFTRFGRVSNTSTNHFPGTGLGLYLGRQLARLQGGEITVESVPGEGSTFTLHLPAVERGPGRHEGRGALASRSAQLTWAVRRKLGSVGRVMFRADFIAQARSHIASYPGMIREEPAPHGALGSKVAVITGGASGIGRTIAKGLARQGARVIIADFDSARLERTVDEILKLGTTDAAQALSTDVRSDASVRSLARDSIKAMGQVDILVNTAGVFLQGKLDRMTTADWTWMLETNLMGAVRTARAFLPHMQARSSGHIINAIPFGGLKASDPFTVPYDSGYAALATFTRGLARELHGTAVHVSLYCLGSKGPRIGQNTRSRGMGRWLRHPDSLEEKVPVTDQTADSLIDALHNPRFLILADPADASLARLSPDELQPGGREPMAVRS